MASDQPLRVLIVDDEPLARQRLEDLLSAEESVEIIGTIDNGLEAVGAIQAQRPDLVFLDVQMPGMTGLDVVREVGPGAMPTVIFATAYDQHALTAFELAALDYLVKPFDDERFEQAFRRARRTIELEEVGRMTKRLLTLLDGEDIALPPQRVTAGTSAHVERIAVETRGQVRVVPVEQIDYVSASGPYAELHVGKKTFLIRERMQTLEDRLDPDRFFRIHRSAIVRLEKIDTLLRGAGGDYAVRLQDGDATQREPESTGRARAASRRRPVTPRDRRAGGPLYSTILEEGNMSSFITLFTATLAVVAAPVDGLPTGEPIADTVAIQEWEVPWADTRPRDPIVDAQGQIWFVGQRGNYVGVLDPESGEFRRFTVPEDAYPHNIIVGPDGDLWYAGNRGAHIGRMDPQTGEVRRYEMPDSAARDPHTLMFSDAGDLWFTVQGGQLHRPDGPREWGDPPAEAFG